MEFIAEIILDVNVYMAALEDQHQQKKSARRLAKKSTNVDLTPMVDLGFLLITFFVFTSTIATPVAMKVEMPYDGSATNDPVCNSCVLTVLLCKNDRVLYYEGDITNAGIQPTSYEEVRHVIEEKRKRVKLARVQPASSY